MPSAPTSSMKTALTAVVGSKAVSSKESKAASAVVTLEELAEDLVTQGKIEKTKRITDQQLNSFHGWLRKFEGTDKVPKRHTGSDIPKGRWCWAKKGGELKAICDKLVERALGGAKKAGSKAAGSSSKKPSSSKATGSSSSSVKKQDVKAVGVKKQDAKAKKEKSAKKGGKEKQESAKKGGKVDVKLDAEEKKKGVELKKNAREMVEQGLKFHKESLKKYEEMLKML